MKDHGSTRRAEERLITAQCVKCRRPEVAKLGRVLRSVEAFSVRLAIVVFCFWRRGPFARKRSMTEEAEEKKSPCTHPKHKSGAHQIREKRTLIL